MKRTKTGGIGSLILITAIFASCAGQPGPTTGAEANPTGDSVAAQPEKPAPESDVPAPWTSVSFAQSLSERLNARDYEAALALFDSVPAEEAVKPEMRKLRLSILISAGKLDDAKSLEAELESELPGDTEVLYAGAMIATAENDRSKRLEFLNRILKVNPNDSAALTDIGLDLLSRKSYPQAKANLLKAMASDPGNVDAMLGLARVYYMTDDLPKTRDTLNLAISKEAGYSVLWAERARAESELGDQNAALRDIEKAVELDPSIYGQWVDYGNYLLPTERRPEAEAAFGKAVDLEPDHYLAYIYRAGLRDELGNAEGAISDYRNVIRLYPRYYFAAEGLGILLWERGDFAGAADAFAGALKYNPQSAYYALMYTLSLYQGGKDDEAKAFMSKYITTLDRDGTEYFLCRLFVDKSGDMDVINRVMKEKNATTRHRYLFYTAMYFNLFSNKTIAQKYFLEVLSVENHGFFEYRLSRSALASMGDAVKG